MTWLPEKIKLDFPILSQKVHGAPLVYLDNAATSQKPQIVIDQIVDYYQKYNANVYRGVHSLSQQATDRYEEVRDKVKGFINAENSNEIIFTRGTTTSLNALARSLEDGWIRPGDEIVLTVVEHHSNLIPWQELAHRTGAKLVYLETDQEGSINLSAVKQQVTEKTKILAIHHVSNVLGIVQPIKELSEIIHQVGGYIVVDGAQAASHMDVDVQELNVDFYVFSGHKMLGPTGIGVLYGKEALLKDLKPTEFGGEMNSQVGRYQSEWKDLPYKFEAGTPNIAGVIGLGAAIDYLNQFNIKEIHQHEAELAQLVWDQLNRLDYVEVYGPAQKDSGIVSFNIQGVHPHDAASFFDVEGIALRAGHHCCEPLMKYLQVPATLRASFNLYNTKEEAEILIKAIQRIREFFANES